MSELSCRGHAGFAAPGEDLVCAGVSAVLGALGLGLTEVAGLPVAPVAGDGTFRVRRGRLPAGAEWNLLLETTVRALEQLQEYYPGFIQVQLLKTRGIRSRGVEDEAQPSFGGGHGSTRSR